MNEFLEAARSGKNDWWRYLISFSVILFFWIFLGTIPVLVLMAYVSLDDLPSTGFTETGFTGVPVLLEFIVTMLTFIPLIVVTLVAVRFIHIRSLKTLITGKSHIRWGRVALAAGVWLTLAACVSVVEAVLYPGRYVLTFQPITLLVFTAFALILIPIQSSSEEFLFRGYLLQWVGLKLKNVWLLSIINGALFFLPHAVNPEMTVDNAVLVGLGYFVMGFFLAFITLQDAGMELALGMHAANNLFAALFANYSTTALPSPSLFTIQILDPVYSLISLVTAMIVFYAIFFGLTRSGTATPPQ